MNWMEEQLRQAAEAWQARDPYTRGIVPIPDDVITQVE